MRIGAVLASIGVAACDQGPGRCLLEPEHSGQPATFWVFSLGDADREVRLGAAQALYDVAGPELSGWVPEVLDRLAVEPDPEVATLLARAVSRCAGRIQDPKTPQRYCGFPGFRPPSPRPHRWAEPLAALLAHPQEEVRGSAIGALQALGPYAEAAVPTLIQMLAADERDARIAAARALATVGPGAAAAAPALEAAARGTDAELRVEAAEALLDLGPEHQAVGLAVLGESRKSIRRTLRAGPPAIPVVASLARKEGFHASKGLDLPHLKHPEAIEAIQAALERGIAGDDPQAKLDALLFAGLIGKDGIRHMIRALDDADPEIRLRAVVLLWMYGAGLEEGAAALAKTLADPDARIRRKAAFALERNAYYRFREFPATIAQLVGALGDADADVRRAAASALGHEGAASALGALADLLDDPDLAVRQTAAQSLGRIGADPESLKRVLAPALESADRGVRLHASFALLALGTDAGALLPAVRDRVFADPDPAMRATGVRQLRHAKLHDAGTIEAYVALLSTAQDPNESARDKSEASEALGAIGADAIPALAVAIPSRCTGPCVQYVTGIVRKLGPAGLPLVPSVLDACRSYTPANACAAWELALLGSETEPAFRAGLRNPSPAVRHASERAIRHLDPPKTALRPPPAPGRRRGSDSPLRLPAPGGRVGESTPRGY